MDFMLPEVERRLLTLFSIEVLLIEDNPDDVRILNRFLSQSVVGRFETASVSLLEEALESLEKASFDIIILDLNLPDSGGLDSLVKINERYSYTPIIILTGLYKHDLEAEAISKGAQDYFIKGEYGSSILDKSIRCAIKRKKELLELKKTKGELEIQAWGLQKTNEGIKLLYNELERKTEELKRSRM